MSPAKLLRIVIFQHQIADIILLWFTFHSKFVTFFLFIYFYPSSVGSSVVWKLGNFLLFWPWKSIIFIVEHKNESRAQNQKTVCSLFHDCFPSLNSVTLSYTNSIWTQLYKLPRCPFYFSEAESNAYLCKLVIKCVLD